MSGGRRRRVPARHAGERGMSLVELLLALTLLVVITGSLLAGLTIARHGLATDRRAGDAGDLDDALLSMSRLVESAYPIASLKDPMHPVARFEGRADALTFIALGDGRALRGGLHSVTIGRDDDALVVEVTPTRETDDAPDPHRTRRVVLRRGLATLRFRYFGQTSVGERPAWHQTWTRAERQPALVTIEIAGAPSRGRPMLLSVALPQT